MDIYIYGKPEAENYWLLSINYGLLWSTVACYVELLGFLYILILIDLYVFVFVVVFWKNSIYTYIYIYVLYKVGLQGLRFASAGLEQNPLCLRRLPVS